MEVEGKGRKVERVREEERTWVYSLRV